MGKTVRMMAAGGMISAAAIDARDIVQRAHEIHATSATGSAALGRVLAVTSLIGGGIKVEGGSVTVRFAGDGGGGHVLAVADCGGDVRGYAQFPDYDPPRRDDSKLNVGEFIGEVGTLTVIKDLRMKEPYVGTIELLSGEVAEDIACYFVESEQIPTAVAAGVLVAPGGDIEAAGAYLIQIMPGASEELAAEVQAAVVAAGAVTARLSDGATPEELLYAVLGGFEPKTVEESEAVYRCDCSRGRVERALVAAGADELRGMINEDGGAEATCRFCDAVYKFTSQDLEELINLAK